MYHLFIVNFFRTFSHFFLHHKFFYKIRWQKLLESYWKLRHEIHTLYVSLNSFALSLVFAPLPTLFESFWQCLFFSFLYNLVSRATCIAINHPWHLLFLRLTQVLHSTWIYLSSYFEIFFSSSEIALPVLELRIGYACEISSIRKRKSPNFYKYRIWGDHRLLSRVYFDDTII